MTDKLVRDWGRRCGEWLTLGMVAGALAACGGGGNGAVRAVPESPPPPPPPPTTPTDQPPINAQLAITNTYVAHDEGYTGQGVTIGFVDSGIMRSNPTVAGRVKSELIYVDPAKNNTSIDDVVGHGTWVASIAAGTSFADFPGGIAPGATLVSARIISDTAPTDDGSGQGNKVTAADAAFFAQTLNPDLIQAGVQVMNNSWGGIYWDTSDASINQAFGQAYTPFVQQGGLVVFAAGNESRSDPSDIASLPTLAPQVAPGWLVAVALDSNHPDQLASYSNACGRAMDYCLAAPGDVIVLDKDTTASTTDPKYWVVSGTSLAAPQVSGAAALVWQAFPYFTNDLVRQTLLGTADDLGAAGPDPVFGYGGLNVGKAVNGPAKFDWGDVSVSFDNLTSTWSNAIDGHGGLIKDGTGTLILTGANDYVGGTAVLGGTLQATQPLPIATVQKEGSLGGDVYVGSAGTLEAVGTSGSLFNAGTVVVKDGNTNVGMYTQTATGILSVSLGSILQVGLNAQLAGTLNVLGENSGYVTTSHQDVLDAGGVVAGTFSQLTTSPGVFLNTTIQYTANSVWLDTTSLSITQAAQAMAIVDPASRAAAVRVQNGFDAINARVASGGTFAPNVLQGAGYIQHSPTTTSAHATLQSLSGQLHAASTAMLFDGINASSDALSEHFDNLMAGRAKPGTWYDSLGWQGDLQRSGYAGATFRSDGDVVGADFRVGAHALLGYAVGASRGYGQLNASWDHNRTWTDHAMAYGGVLRGSWYASAQIGGGWFRQDMQRLLWLGRLAAPVASNYSGSYLTGSMEGGYRFGSGKTRITPFVEVRYQRLDEDAFAEAGGYGFGLMANARTIGRLQAGLGVRAQSGWRLANGMRMQLDGSAAWRRALHQYGDAFDASFTGFDAWMPVSGIGLSRDESVLRAGLSLWPTRTFGLRLGLMREQGERQQSRSAMLQGTLRF